MILLLSLLNVTAIHSTRKTDAIHLLEILCLMIAGISKMYINEINIKNRAYNYYFKNLIKAKKLDSKNILIDEENYKDLVLYFTSYVHGTLVKMFRLHCYELMGKIEEDEGKNI